MPKTAGAEIADIGKDIGKNPSHVVAHDGRSRMRVPTTSPERQKSLRLQTESPRRSELAFRAIIRPEQT